VIVYRHFAAHVFYRATAMFKPQTTDLLDLAQARYDNEQARPDSVRSLTAKSNAWRHKLAGCAIIAMCISGCVFLIFCFICCGLEFLDRFTTFTPKHEIPYLTSTLFWGLLGSVAVFVISGGLLGLVDRTRLSIVGRDVPDLGIVLSLIDWEHRCDFRKATTIHLTPAASPPLNAFPQWTRVGQLPIYASEKVDKDSIFELAYILNSVWPASSPQHAVVETAMKGSGICIAFNGVDMELLPTAFIGTYGRFAEGGNTQGENYLWIISSIVYSRLLTSEERQRLCDEYVQVEPRAPHDVRAPSSDDVLRYFDRVVNLAFLVGDDRNRVTDRRASLAAQFPFAMTCFDRYLGSAGLWRLVKWPPGICVNFRRRLESPPFSEREKRLSRLNSVNESTPPEELKAIAREHYDRLAKVHEWSEPRITFERRLENLFSRPSEDNAEMLQDLISDLNMEMISKRAYAAGWKAVLASGLAAFPGFENETPKWYVDLFRSHFTPNSRFKGLDIEEVADSEIGYFEACVRMQAELELGRKTIQLDCGEPKMPSPDLSQELNSESDAEFESNVRLFAEEAKRMGASDKEIEDTVAQMRRARQTEVRPS